jgi:ParB/RepB/Spo0J family partition protein
MEVQMPKLEQRFVGQCKPDPTQPRKHFDETDLRALGESLKVRQNDPIQVMPDGTIIDGERRWRAAKLVGLEKLDAIVTDKPLSPKELGIIRLSTFLHRADLSGYEKWTACAELMCMNPDWQGKDLAEHLHLDPSSVTRLLSPSRCTEAWQAALREGKVSISDCYAASKLPESDQAGLLNLKLGGASRDMLEKEGRRSRNAAKNGHADTIKLEKLPVALNSGIVIVKAKQGQEALNLAAARLLLVDALAKVDNAIKLGYSARTATLAWAETKDKVRKPRNGCKAKETS